MFKARRRSEIFRILNSFSVIFILFSDHLHGRKIFFQSEKYQVTSPTVIYAILPKNLPLITIDVG